ncbi:MotA/TolQ/ExbB proton channel family protein [Faunimonas sp. B44]|uniref:MotA/TolQ/ExbB proton channel family protein n=1 Tax=Faunimonas sp. B44 TaxID=3461493 RepID=UPI004043A2B4
MARDFDPYKLSSPRVFLIRMIIFLVIAAFVPLVLYRQLTVGFMANPGLNGLILGVLFIGIALAFRNVLLLMPEVTWVNSFRRRDTDPTMPTPRLLAPMATLLRDRADSMALSTSTWRSILDSIATRLDENREILRYMTGLLVFLGLLGTFWGLITTIGAVSSTIQSLDIGSGNTATIFENLKSGLQAPLAGMGIAFSSSLFGLASSLVLGFLDLQAGQAQNRFYTELEDWLSTITDLEELEFEDAETGSTVREIKVSVDRLSRAMQDGGGRAATAAMANLAEGIQALVQHMRGEQQMVRDWVESQAEQQRMLQRTLNRIADASDRGAMPRRPVEPDEDRPAKVLGEYRREG